MLHKSDIKHRNSLIPSAAWISIRAEDEDSQDCEAV